MRTAQNTQIELQAINVVDALQFFLEGELEVSNTNKEQEITREKFLDELETWMNAPHGADYGVIEAWESIDHRSPEDRFFDSVLAEVEEIEPWESIDHRSQEDRFFDSVLAQVEEIEPVALPLSNGFTDQEMLWLSGLCKEALDMNAPDMTPARVRSWRKGFVAKTFSVVFGC